MALHRVADLQGTMLDASRHLAQAAVMRTFAEVQADEREQASRLAAVPDATPARRRARHKRDPGRPLMQSVKGIAPAGGLVAAFRHSWAAHPVATVATGFTAATLVIGGGGAAAVHVATSGGGAATGPAPAASVVAATPVLQPVSPSSPSFASALTKPKTDATLSFPVQPVPPYVFPAQGPGDPQGPAPQGQAPAPQVKLIVSRSLDLGVAASGTIRVTAYGGPADWTAQASDPGMMLDQASGSLQPGDSAVITVTLTADLQALAGPGSVTITYGDGQSVTVAVNWTVVPLPVPSPADTTLPTDTPTDPASVAPSVIPSS